MIDWKKAQERLGVATDGIRGRGTLTALLGIVGPSASPETLRSLGNSLLIHGEKYGCLDSAPRLADFLAQCANETGGFKVFVENLNYSAEALMRTWPSRFDKAMAATLARQPESIANEVYGGRMGNVKPGDGWAYRGRGMLQLTGRGNYELFDRRLGLGLDTNPDLAAVPALSLLIALDFYEVNDVWSPIDRGDTVRARKITNGGSIGLDNVNSLRQRLLRILL